MNQNEKKEKAVRKLPQKRVEAILTALKKKYPDAVCGLRYEGDGWKLMVLSRLSAQCTDKRVNDTAPTLFVKYPTPCAMANSELCELEETIRPCGLFRSKARDIRAACRMLTEEYNGVLPDEIDALLKFPGIGRKIANLIIGDLYGKPAIVADTHCMRVSARIGFSKEGIKDPLLTEKVLKANIPPEEQNDFCHRLVLLGREICKAGKPNCRECPLSAVCEHAKQENRKG